MGGTQTGQSFDANGYSQTFGGAGTGQAPTMQGGWSPTQQAAGTQAQYNFMPASGIHGPSQGALDQQTLAGIPVNAQMSRFNQLLPILTGELGKLGTNGAATAGGTNTAPPPISTGPTLNPQQIQQQVNTSRAANDQSTATGIQNSNSSLAGRGFGSNSPLQMALNQGAQNSNMATNTANETATRLNAAQQNAAQTLNSQQALSNQWATGNQLDIQRRAPVFAQQNALIAALGGMMS